MDIKSSKAMNLAVKDAISAIAAFNGVGTRDLPIPVRRSNQLGYEATDVGSWSFVGSNLPMRNESINEMIHEINHIPHILKCGNEIK